MSTTTSVPAPSGPGPATSPDPDERVSDHLPVAEVVVDDPAARRRANRAARRRRWRARSLFGAALAACVTVGVVEASDRLEARGRLAVDGAVLAADPVDVISTSPGNVVSTFVRAGERVATGDVVALVDAVRPGPEGGEQRVPTPLAAPVDGVVAAVPARGGAALRSGDVVVRLYQPDTLRLEVDVPLERAADLHLGTAGRFRAHGVDPVDVVLTGIEPAPHPAPDGQARARLQLEPVAIERVRALLVGLPFDGWLDTRGPAEPSAP